MEGYDQALEEAEEWLLSARNLYSVEVKKGRRRYAVVAAQCIHSIIRANDALSLKFLNQRAKQHSDAAVLFLELIKRNKIKSSEAKFRDILIKTAREKSSIEYYGEAITSAEASKWLENTENFLKMTREYLS